MERFCGGRMSQIGSVRDMGFLSLAVWKWKGFEKKRREKGVWQLVWSLQLKQEMKSLEPGLMYI